MSKHLPDWAEDQFRTFCSDAGMTVNQSQRDRFGWDFLVEFDHAPDQDLSHDLQRGSASARIQVKSKTGGKPTIKLKLSNALRFVKEADPCFLSLIWQSKDKLQTRYYTRFFDRKLMERVLKRAREAERDGQSKLHKIDLSISLNSADETGLETGHWLRIQIESLPLDYCTEKKKLADTLGYDDNSIKGVLTIDQRKLPDFIDHTLGLKGELELENVLLEKHRFNIPDKKPLVSGKPERVSIVANPDRATLTITGEGGRSVTFEGEFRASPIPGLPLENRKASFINDFITATLQPTGHFHIKYSHKAYEPLPINQLGDVIAFFLIAKGRIRLKLQIENREPIETETFSMSGDVDAWHIWFDETINSLNKIDIGKETIFVSADQLAARYEEICQFLDMQVDGVATLRANVIKGAPFAFPEIKSLVGYLSVPINNRLLWVICRRPCLDVELTNDEFIGKFGNPIILDSMYSSISLGEARAEMVARYKLLISQMGKGTLVLNDGNLMEDENKDLEIQT